MIENNYIGKFIVFEGLDGSGQSTQAGLLKDFLIGKGFDVILTKEPTRDSEAGKKIKEILEEKIKKDPAKLQELFTRDREEHLDKLIIPALKERKFIVCDRYFFSTFAYGVSDGLDLDWLIKINENFLLPDLTFLLKVKPEVCIKRIEKRGTPKALFEKTEKLAKVWQIYEKLPEKFKDIFVIDGEKTIEEVFSQVKEILLDKFKL